MAYPSADDPFSGAEFTLSGAVASSDERLTRNRRILDELAAERARTREAAAHARDAAAHASDAAKHAAVAQAAALGAADEDAERARRRADREALVERLLREREAAPSERVQHEAEKPSVWEARLDRKERQLERELEAGASAPAVDGAAPPPLEDEPFARCHL